MFRVPGFIDARIDFAKLLNCCSLVAYALQKRRVAIRFRAEKKTSLTDSQTHRLPQILYWYAGGADGRAGAVRSRDYQIFWDR